MLGYRYLNKHIYCLCIFRYLGNLDPGYSQHSALATLELSKVNRTLET